ncbi:MAG: ABC transporter substrate-binding protein [Candidatus Entotheonellia bacterium]
MATDVTLKKVRLSVSNAVHSLAVLVARDEGLFRDQGLDVEIVRTPGSAHVDTDRQAVRDAIFERPLEALYNTGGVDQFRLCEWGVMKRAVDGELCGQRSTKIVALGAAMSKFAIVAFPDSDIFEPEQLKDIPVAVTIYNGSHFTTLKMLEGFLRKDEIKVTNAGTMHQRLEALRRGELAAATFNEPWISVAQKQGFRIIMESHSTRSEAAGDEMDGPTLAAMFRAEAAAAEMINATPARYGHYITEEARGLLEPNELQTWRLLYAPPASYTRERFERTYQWMLGYPELVTPGATYESVVDNRAWE